MLMKCSYLEINYFIFTVVLHQIVYLVSSSENNCYDHVKRPVRCSPDFINAAFNRPVVSTNTCGNFFSKFSLINTKKNFLKILVAKII